MSAPLPPARASSLAAESGWAPVHLGKSTATVFRSSDGQVHAKCADAGEIDELAVERDKISWLAHTGIPCPEVVDWIETSAGAVLVTTTLAGIPASDIPPERVPRAVDSQAELLRQLHALAVEDCPWVRRLDFTLNAAARAVETGEVDVDDFDRDRRGRSARDLLTELVAWRPEAERLEPDDLVVCHGDPCLPNVLIDPETGICAGVLDLDRLGVADRYLDLALITRSMAASDLNDQYGATDATRLLQRYGVPAADDQRLEFYRLLDEFF